MSVKQIAMVLSIIMFIAFIIFGIINVKKDKAVAWAFFVGGGLCSFYLIAEIFS